MERAPHKWFIYMINIYKRKDVNSNIKLILAKKSGKGYMIFKQDTEDHNHTTQLIRNLLIYDE